MNFSSTARQILGYEVLYYSVSADILHGETVLNGKVISHLLSRGIRRENPIDVGRDENNELVWIHPEVLDQQSTPTLSSVASAGLVPSLFDPPQEIIHRATERRPEVEETSQGIYPIRDVVRRIPRKVFFAVGVAVVLTAVGVSVVGAPGSEKHSMPLASEYPSAQASQPANEPEQAAIDFVLSGQIKGVSVTPTTTRENLSAHVVSRSGEIVLVEVQEEAEGNLTTFATLLLQKSGATWRIRQVFDPR